MKTKSEPARPIFTEVHGFQLLEHLPNGVMVADRSTSSFVYTNKHMQHLLGYTAEELLGKTPDFIHPADELDRVMMAFQAMLTNDMHQVENIRFITKSRQIVVCQIKANLLELNGTTFICGFMTEMLNEEQSATSGEETAIILQRLNAAQEVGRMGFWSLYHANQKLEWSDNTFRLFGFEPRSFEPSMEFLARCVHEEDLPKVMAVFNAHLTNQVPYDVVHRIKSDEKEAKYLRERCVTSFDNGGNPIYSFGTVVDVTSIEQARLDALKSLEQLQEILSNSRSFIWEVDAQGKITHLSENTYDILGYNVQSLLGQSFQVLVHADYLDPVKLTEKLTANQEERVVDQYIPLRKQVGELVWVSASAKIRRTKAGEFDGFVGSATEVTARKLAEEELQASETKFRTIAETLPGVILMTDTNFRMQYVSEGITKMLGLSTEAFINQKREDRLTQKSLQEVEAFFKQQKEYARLKQWPQDLTSVLQLEVKCANGEFKWVQLTASPLFDAEKNLKGYLGVVIDITDLIQREESLERLNQLLEEGGRMAQMGTWELDLLTSGLSWSKITYEMHEVGENFVPTLDNSLDFYLDEYKQELSEQVAKIVKEGGKYDIEAQIRTAKGNVRWVRTRGHSQMQQGLCVRLWGVIQDIDNEKRKSLELIQERTRLDNVIAATKVATWYWNVQTGETQFNARWSEMIGYDLAELEPTTIGTWEHFCHPTDLKVAEQKLDAYFKGDTLLYETEFRMKHKAGHWVWIRDVGSVIEWTADGKPLAMYGAHEDISEAVRVREDLLAAEEKYRIIADNNFNWEFWQGTDGNYLYHSPSVERITGYKVEELFSTDHILQLIHPDDLKLYQEHHLDVACGQQAGEISFRIIDKAGKIHYIDHLCQPIQNYKGEPMGIRGTNIDVTERQEAQIELRKLLKAVEQSQASIVITNLAGLIEYVNPFFTQLTGYTVEEAIGQNPRILSTGHTHPNEYKLMFAKLQKGETWQGEFLNRKKNGELYWEYATISPVRNEAGVISNYVAIKEDITERKKLGETLRASELKYRLIAENTTDVIWVFNFNQNRFTYVSPSVQQLRGFTVEEALAQPIESTMTELARKNFEEGLKPNLEAYMKGEINELSPMVVEIRQPHKNGDWVWVEVSLKFHKNESGEVEAIGVSRDIQERKKAEELRERIQIELQQSEARFKTLFYDNASVMYLIDTNSGVFVDANRAALNFYGYTKEEMLGKSITDVNVDFQNWKSKVSYLKSHGIGRFEFRHSLANGELVDVELFSCLIHIDGQSMIHEIVHDISDRNKYLREVERQNEILKEIAWTQSHVVRAPLARIMSLIELIDTEHASIYSEPLLLQSLKTSANELDELVHQITQKTLEIKPIN